ncbi:MAG: T9SS type A sorting domain-containing protein [Flavobacteriales bacterium]|nr:T9SS type A sorting domain-containing protein [Flavobacteriales bacterium]
MILKKIALLVLLFMSVCSYAQYDSIPYNSYDRTYLVHLPTGYTGTTNLPLIIAMHGGFGNASKMETLSQLSLKADIENFIVVYPEGVEGGILNNRTWNAGWCCGFSSNNNIDDVGFIDSLLTTLINQYSIDTNRIYATGISNGGFMSYRLACELSNKISAIAPVASSMSMTSCSPSRPVPIIHFHSSLDSNVPYIGGVGSGVSNHYNSPIDSILNVWSNKNTCLNINDTIINNTQYTLTKWSNCSCSTEIHYYLTEDGGHSWPGGIANPIGDPVSTYINANDLMWTFFQQYSLNCSPLSVPNDFFEESIISIYPNPTDKYLKIQTEIEYHKLKISIYSILGEQLLKVENQTKIDISHLPIGAYFILINIDGNIKAKKILKIE